MEPPIRPDHIHFFTLSKPKSKLSDSELILEGSRYFTERIEPHIEEETLNIFTDGSVDPTTKRAGIGIVAIDCSTGRATQHPTTHRHSLRISDGSGSMVAELAAIRAALQKYADVGHPSIIIHTDSKSALQALLHHPPTDNKELISDISGFVENSFSIISFSWLPSHSGIAHNDAADEEARRALERPIIDIQVPSSMSSIKETTKFKAKSELHADIHIASITNNTRHSRYTEINPTLKPPDFKQLTRKQSVILSRTRLHTFNRCHHGDLAMCAYCGDEVRLTPEHYLAACPVTSTKHKLLDLLIN
jgi:ribonuclease HI